MSSTLYFINIRLDIISIIYQSFHPKLCGIVSQETTDSTTVQHHTTLHTTIYKIPQTLPQCSTTPHCTPQYIKYQTCLTVIRPKSPPATQISHLVFSSQKLVTLPMLDHSWNINISQLSLAKLSVTISRLKL